MPEVLEILRRLAYGEGILQILGHVSVSDWQEKDEDATLSGIYRNKDTEARKAGDVVFAYLTHRLLKEQEEKAPKMKDRVMAIWEAEPDIQVGWTQILKRLGVKQDDPNSELSKALNQLTKEGWLIQVKNTKGWLLYQRPTRGEKGESGRQVFLRHQEAGTLKCSYATFKRRIQKGWLPESAAIIASSINDGSEPQ